MVEMGFPDSNSSFVLLRKLIYPEHLRTIQITRNQINLTAMRYSFYTLIFLTAFVYSANAQTTLDSSFGTTGAVVTNFGFGPTNDVGQVLAIQADGKILLAGRSGDKSAIARYKTNGTLDSSFGTNGRETFLFNPAGTAEGITDLIILPDGSLVVAGIGYQYAFVSKVSANGTIDAGFTLAMKTSPGSGNSKIGRQSDGKIVWATHFYSSGTSITRLSESGLGDAGFSSSFDPDLRLSDMEMLSTDEFLLAGTEQNSFALAKYSASGLKQGITGIIGFGAFSSAQAVAVQADGKIIIAGSTSVSSGTDFAVARLLPDGSLDNSFSGDGKVTTDFAELDGGNSVLVQADGKIVVSGWRQAIPGDTVFASVRYLSSGLPDVCYGNNSKLLIDLPSSMSFASALQSDGKIVFGGFSNLDFALARYESNAQPTTWYRDFDGDGYGNPAIAVVSCPQPQPLLMKVDPNCIDIPLIFNCPTKLVYWVSKGGDCNDFIAAIRPGAVELCDGYDNDCDGQIDEGLPTTTYYVDADGDGYGASPGVEFCKNPGAGYVATGGDCNDNSASVHPGSSASTEICDGIDNNCDGVIDEGCSGKPTINISNVTVYESEGIAVLNLDLSFMTSLQLKVSFSTADGTAVSNKKEKDYKSIGATVITIPPGTLSTTVSVPVYTDSKTENNEYFYVGLSKPTNCILGNVTGVVTILDGAPAGSRPGADIITSAEAAAFDVQLYPNPGRSEFNLQVRGEAQASTVQVRNALGQLVQDFRMSGSTHRFGRELKAGIYFVQVQQGVNVKTIKLIKF